MADTFVLDVDVAEMAGGPVDDARVRVEAMTSVAGNGVVVDPTNGRLYVTEVHDLPDGKGQVVLPKPSSMAPANYQLRATVTYRRDDARYFDTIPGIIFTVPANATTLYLGKLAPEQLIPPAVLSELAIIRQGAQQAATDAATARTGAQQSAASAATERVGAEMARNGAETARQQAQDLVLSDLGATDGQTRALIDNPNSQTAKGLAATGTKTAQTALASVITKAPELNGWARSNLRKARAALARVHSGAGDMSLLCIGDSTTAGQGVNVAPIAYAAWPQRLAELLSLRTQDAKRGLAVPSSQLVQAGGGSATDSRWTLGAGWTLQQGGFGNQARYVADASSSGALVFTENTFVDSYYIYYRESYGGGNMSVTATGGTAVVASQAEGASPLVKRVMVTAGGHSSSNVVTITRTGGAAIEVIAVEPFSSAARRIRVGNAGIYGTRAVQDWNGMAGGIVESVAADLTIISLGINDAIIGNDTTGYRTAMNNLINRVRATGDVILMTPVPCRAAQGAGVVANIESYRQALLGLGLPVLDLTARWGSGDQAAADGFMSDNIHPSSAGYADIAQGLASSIADI